MLASQARRFGETLVERHVLARDVLEAALAESARTGVPLPALLLEHRIVGSKDLTAALADSVGVRYGDGKVVRMGNAFRTYSMSRDPHETAGTRGAPEPATMQIQQYLDDGARRRRALDAPRGVTISPELHDALRGLGYVE